jgi:hypothetical protein
MATKRVRDLCGLYCVAEFADYQRAEFFMYLIGTGVSRSRYELTAHHRKTGALLFSMQVEASARGLEARARKAGTNSDVQAVAVALEDARQIVDADDYPPGAHFQLQVESETAWLQRIGVK